MPSTRFRWLRWLLAALIVAVAASTGMFALRSYSAFLLLRSARAAGVPQAGTIRPWMTLRYVTDTYGASVPALTERLALAPGTDADTPLVTLAQREGLSPFRYIQRVQQAVADEAPGIPSGQNGQAAGWIAMLEERLLAALLVYGYPVLGLTLALGAIGAPLPTGLATALAGSLAATGRMSWAWAGMVAVVASVLGDGVGFGLGRIVRSEVLARYGRLLGYTAARQRRAEALFARWGLLSVLVSRTLVSHVSPVVNLAAGAGRYRAPAFLAAAEVGRVLWTSAYLGLGYGVGGDLDAATGLLKALTGLLVSLALLVGFGLLAVGRSTAGVGAAAQPRN
jgi:membrane protein DedA with SNARE-associated domain